MYLWLGATDLRTYNHMPAGIVSDFMLREVVSVPPDMGIFDLAEIFVREIGRRFMVVENDKLVGQITRRDLLRGIKSYWDQPDCASQAGLAGDAQLDQVHQGRRVDA